MNYKTAIEFFDTLNDDNKAKEIYAHFGLAIYFAQIVEQQAIIMIAISRQSNKNITTAEQVESLWNDYDFGSRTLGVLINEIKQLYQLTEKDATELKEILKQRNFLTHDYFRFNTELFYSDSGQKRMIRDFIDFKARVQELDNLLSKYTQAYCDKIGLTEEKVNRILEQTTQEWGKKIITGDHKTYKK